MLEHTDVCEDEGADGDTLTDAIKDTHADINTYEDAYVAKDYDASHTNN